MAFNIKNEATHELAREVAAIAGESMTQAVDTALRERKARLSRYGLADRLSEIARDAAKHVPPGMSSAAVDNLLYDERGLPK